MKIRKGFGVFFWMIVMVLFWSLVAGVYFAWADDYKKDKTSYYQYNPNPVQQPATVWNPVLTETKDGKKDSRSYFQYTPNPNSVLAPGTIWNPLVTEKKK